MNYRGLNHITRKNHYPLNLIKEILNGILKAKLLTVGVSAAVAFTEKSLWKFVCKLDKYCP